MTGQVNPKNIRRENSNAHVPTSTQLPLARTASAAPIKQEAVINVSQSAGINVTQPLIQEKNKLEQDRHSSSNSLLKHLAGKPIYGTVNLKKEIIKPEIDIKTEQQEQLAHLHPPYARNQPMGQPNTQKQLPLAKTEIKTEQVQTFAHPANPTIPAIVKKEEESVVENKPFQCQFCLRCFPNHASRAVHISSNHR